MNVFSLGFVNFLYLLNAPGSTLSRRMLMLSIPLSSLWRTEIFRGHGAAQRFVRTTRWWWWWWWWVIVVCVLICCCYRRLSANSCLAKLLKLPTMQMVTLLISTHVHLKQVNIVTNAACIRHTVSHTHVLLMNVPNNFQLKLG